MLKSRPFRTLSNAVGVVAAAALAGAACSDGKAAVSPRPVVRFVGTPPGTFVERVVRESVLIAEGFSIEVMGTGTAGDLAAIDRGDADVTMGMADSIYFTYREQMRDKGSRLRAIATLQVIPIHLLVRDDPAIRRMADLRGRTLGIPSASPIYDLLLETLGMTSGIRRESPVDAANRVANGSLDATFVASYYPAPTVTAATRRGARVLSIEGPAIEPLRARYPFVRFVVIPAGTYAGQTEPIHTIGVDNLYVCRADLSEELVYQLTRQLFQVLPKVSASFQAVRLLDMEQTPATPIPLHEGAARYYREWELFR